MNKFSTEPTLKLALELLKKDVFSSLNCHAIGKIEEFDSTKQTASVSINYSIKSINSSKINPRKDYPLLPDCPVVILSGGKASLRFPIKAGDPCLVLFNDRDMDNWFAGSSQSLLSTDRQHSLADAIVLVGIRSLAQSIDDYDPDKTELVHDTDKKLSISDDKALMKKGGGEIYIGTRACIKNDAANLFQILDGTLAIIQSLITTPCVIGNPVTISPAQAAQIAALKTQLGLLME